MFAGAEKRLTYRKPCTCRPKALTLLHLRSFYPPPHRSRSLLASGLPSSPSRLRDQPTFNSPTTTRAVVVVAAVGVVRILAHFKVFKEEYLRVYRHPSSNPIARHRF